MIRKRIFIAAPLVATSLMSAPLALPASLYASQGNPGTAMLRANNSDTGYRAARITSLSEHGEALVSGVWSPDSTVNNPVMGS